MDAFHHENKAVRLWEVLMIRASLDVVDRR